MNAYFFSHHTPPLLAPPQVTQKAAIAAGAHRQGLHQSEQGHARTPSTQNGRGVSGQGGERDDAHRKAAARSLNGVRDAALDSSAIPPAVLRLGPTSMVSKQPPIASRTPLSPRATSPVATAIAPPPHRPVPCLILYSPQGPRPLDGLTTVTLAHPGSSAAVVPRRGPLQTCGGSLKRLSADGSASLSPPVAVVLGTAAGHRATRSATASTAVRASPQPPNGIRCVYDRDTRSRLLHITPGTEVDFSSCMRLPSLAVTPASATGAAPAPALFAATPVHTVVAVQFCVAAPTLPTAARHQAGTSRPELPVSPIPPPGSFHLELLLRTGTVSETFGGRSRTTDRGGSGRSGGYRLRFTNTGHGVQRHAHHTKISLHCVRTAQWVQLFLDLEALLQSCREAGAVVARGAHCRLQELRIGSSGSATSTGGVYVRRIIAGHGLPFPSPAIDHLVTADGVPGLVAVTGMPMDSEQERARDFHGERSSYVPGSTTLQQCSTNSGSCWVSPEALRLPAEAGETLCVFVRTGDEYILSESPALPNPAEAPPLEDEVHAGGRNDGTEATQARWKADSSANDVYRDTSERRARSATPDSAALRPTQAVSEAAPKPLTSSLSAALPSHRPQYWQPNHPHQQQRPVLENTHRRHREAEAGAARAFEGQIEPSRGQHYTALELLRMHDQQHRVQPQPAPQHTGAKAAAHVSTPVDPPLSPPPPPSAAYPRSPVSGSSLSASDDAEMFVVREVSDAEQLAPATPPRYPANQLMTGKPPLRVTQPQPLITTKIVNHTLDAGPMAEVVVQHVEEDVAIEDVGDEGFCAHQRTDLSLSATTSITTPTTVTTPEASVLSVVSYSSAVELMEEMNERVRRIHTVLAGAKEEAAASASTFASIAAQPQVRNPPSRQVTPPPRAQGIRSVASVSGATGLPVVALPPRLTDVTPNRFSSSLPSAPAAANPADLMNAVLGGRSCGAAASTSAVPNTSQKSTATAMGAATKDSVPRVFPANCTTNASAFPDNTNAILKLWSSVEMPLHLQVPSPRPATATLQRGPLAERPHEHQAAPSLSSSAAASPHAGDARSAAMSSPASAATSWTFHSAPLTPQTPSILKLSNKSGTAGEALSRGGGASSTHETSAGGFNGDLPQRPSFELRTAAPEAVAVAEPPLGSSSGAATRAVVWRRPVPVPGPFPSLRHANTQHTFQDEVRLTGTPLSKQEGVSDAERGDARRMTTLPPKQNAGATPLGMQTPFTPALAGWLGAPSQQRGPQTFTEVAAPVCVGGLVPPPPQSGRSLSTVSSFRMWLPSSSVLTLSAARGRYPSAVTPPRGGGDRHGGPLSDSSSGTGSAPPPRLGITSTPLTSRPPMPHPSVVHMPQITADVAVPISCTAAAALLSPLVQHQEQQQQQQQQQTLHSTAAAAAALTRGPPQHVFVPHHKAHPDDDSQLPEELGEAEKRYMYDCVLKCYLDLETNVYVNVM
ncbi:hypothetical protein JKF63_05418 [Porcisia hertigi]|uniref:Uncharacterized protein n=1 Tax=Porcisia hertigi TaxID=2761500 RepID=A0A836IEW4_9TRYP|nr:hypothetical protein JKF63_05418 [Porcisia hertigi]